MHKGLSEVMPFSVSPAPDLDRVPTSVPSAGTGSDRKSVIVATIEAPHPKGHGGCAQTIGWFVDHFLRNGFDVRILSVEPPLHTEGQPIKKRREDAKRHLLDIGVSEVRFIPETPIDPLRRRPPTGFPTRVRNGLIYRWYRYKKRKILMREATAALNEMKGDLCFIFVEFLEILGGHRIEKPSLCWLGHPGEPYIKMWVESGHIKLLGSRLLAKFFLPAIYFAHHRRLRRCTQGIDIGVQANRYYFEIWRKIRSKRMRLEILDHIARDESQDLTHPDWVKPSATPPYRIALVGHLRGNLTKAGLMLLGDEILPALERRGLMADFRFDIIGKFEPEPHIARRLDYPNVRYLGFVDNLADEIQQADAVLVPIPVAPGAGMRLSTMSSLSTCIITHRVTEASHDQYRDGKNCLMAETGDEFADALVRACSDDALNKKLRNAARKTFEEHFEPKVFFESFDRLVEQALNER